MAQPCKRLGQTPDPSHMPSKLQDQRAGERNCGDTNEPTADDGASTIEVIDEKVDDSSDMDDNFKMVTRADDQMCASSAYQLLRWHLRLRAMYEKKPSFFRFVPKAACTIFVTPMSHERRPRTASRYPRSDGFVVSANPPPYPPAP
ncbi:hypothetical protein HPB51_025703 [Rhipicephalus microplus]|uniref:Uncharacterized protein n=1 Tax=Rhipicephalus microplus TaxID=6941 RepID=A0A9J6EPJ8_RHIMP|nr:hypothetical protein HPB51_025703 [Rhipicephalus microplus]